MGLTENITTKVKQILNKEFVVKTVNYVPQQDDANLNFNGGLEFSGTVLHINIKNFGEILNRQNLSTAVKLNEIYLNTIIEITKVLGGEMRSFNIDGILSFFPGATKNTLSNAVKAAMQICFLISNPASGINEIMGDHNIANFGIGLDFGNTLASKTIVGGNIENIIWIGNPINRSNTISAECNTPYYIGVSNDVYINLIDEVKFHKRKNPITGLEENVNMWTPFSIDHDSKTETIYKTNYFWRV